MLAYCLYLLYRASVGLISALPLPAVFRLGQTLGFVAWVVSRKYRKLAQHNLAIALRDEKSPRQLRRLTRRHFQRLGANLLSSIRLSTMPIDQVSPRVEVKNIAALHDALRTGRGVILVIGHLGAWEVISQLVHYADYVPHGAVFQALGNRHIDAHIRQGRARAGVRLFDRREGFQAPADMLRAGGIVGILADQHAGDRGVWTPFFGRLASTTPLPALLSKRAGSLIVNVAVYTTGIATWRGVIGETIDPAEISVEKVTARINEIMAAQIRVSPENWFWVHNRWKTPRPNFLLSNYRRGVYLPPTAMPQPFRILIRAPNWLGDSVISAPAVRAIKRGRPDAHITIAAPAKIASLWKLVPEVDEILPLPEKSLFQTARLFKKQEPFEVAVLFPNSTRVALEAWLAGIPRRVGYRGHTRSWLLNQIVPESKMRGPLRHQVERYLHLARTLGASDESHETDTTHPTYTSHESMRLALCPGAEYGPAKRWLPERFAEVATAVAEKHPSAQWHLFGTAADAAVGEQIAQPLGDRAVNRIGQTSLEELIAELRACRLLLTNDTGTMHLATLLGVPVVAIFGSTEDRLTGPLGDGHTVMRHHVECSPCFLRECPLDFRCMKAVTSEEVTAAVLAKL